MQTDYDELQKCHGDLKEGSVYWWWSISRARKNAGYVTRITHNGFREKNMNTLQKSGHMNNFTVKNGIWHRTRSSFLRDQILGCRILPSEIRPTCKRKKILGGGPWEKGSLVAQQESNLCPYTESWVVGCQWGLCKRNIKPILSVQSGTENQQV